MSAPQLHGQVDVTFVLLRVSPSLHHQTLTKLLYPMAVVDYSIGGYGLTYHSPNILNDDPKLSSSVMRSSVLVHGWCSTLQLAQPVVDSPLLLPTLFLASVLRNGTCEVLPAVCPSRPVVESTIGDKPQHRSHLH